MTSLHIHNATPIDGTGADPRPGVSVPVEDSRIARIAPVGGQKSGGTGGSRPLVGGFRGCPPDFNKSTYRAGGWEK